MTKRLPDKYMIEGKSYGLIQASCSYIAGGVIVNIKVNANGLATCPHWKKCKGHGEGLCAETQIHNETMAKIKEQAGLSRKARQGLMQLVRRTL